MGGVWSVRAGVIANNKHATKAAVVTVPGKPGDELAPGHTQQHPQARGVEMKKYLVVIEKTGTGYSAYSPDLPGCISAGASREEIEKNMEEAIEFHLDGLRQSGYPIPEPQSYSRYVEVPA